MNADPSNPLNPLSLFPKALNHLLKAEPWAREQLMGHHAKILCLRLPPLELRLAVTIDGYVCVAAHDVLPNVSIELPWSALPSMLAQDSSEFMQASMRQAKLTGDVDFAQTISLVAQNLRWEVEEDLSQLVGDIAAHRIVALGRALTTQLKTTRQKVAENLAEYFLEENPQLVRPRTVDALTSNVRALRDRLARLEKRIERLERLSPHNQLEI